MSAGELEAGAEDAPLHTAGLDPLGGIAGDMFAAAALDAYPDLLGPIRDALREAGVPEGVTATVEATRRGGFAGTRFAVQQDTTTRPPRTLPAVRELFDGSGLTAGVRGHATGIFSLLAEAEARVHGKPLAEVHFHEVSDWDSVVDIVAAARIIEALGARHWRLGLLPLGGGTVRTAHGSIPVPAPATAALLTGFRFEDDGIPGERITPTGAAILRYLRPVQRGAAPAVLGALHRVGVGCGTRDLDGRANILRLCTYTAPDSGAEHDWIEELAFEVDDMTAEEIALGADRLRATPGVVDVTQVSLVGKKGRASTGLRLLVRPADLESAVTACFAQTSTLGLRHASVQRRILRRETVHRETALGMLPVKRAHRPGGAVSEKTESDALASGATLEERRRADRDARLGGRENDGDD